MNSLDEPVFLEVSKPLLTELGIHHRLESCDVPLLILNQRSWVWNLSPVVHIKKDIVQ